MTPPGTARNGRKSAETALATRATLIDIGSRLFAEQGYVQTSIRDVAHAAGVTTGAIYGHFRNKADLLAEAINARTIEQLESQSMRLGEHDHVETLTRLARDFKKRRRLRALLVQGSAAAQTDAETGERLRQEHRLHIEAWIEGYERNRAELGIDDSVDIEAAVLATWALELGLGVLESVGLEPRSTKGWSDIHNRLARGLQLAPDPVVRKRSRRPAASRRNG